MKMISSPMKTLLHRKKNNAASLITGAIMVKVASMRLAKKKKVRATAGDICDFVWRDAFMRYTHAISGPLSL